MAVADLLLIPVTSILWRIGGKGGWPGARYVRRIGVPIAVSVVAFLHGVSWLWIGLYIAAFFGTSTLPNTLIGTSIWNAPWWLPIKGLIYGLTVWVLELQLWLLGLIGAVIFSVLFSYAWFSNNLGLKDTKDPHANLELMVGAAYGLIAWFFIT